MKWLNKGYVYIAVRCAVVVGGIAVGATMPPPANAEQLPAPALLNNARPMQSFAGVMRGAVDKAPALQSSQGVLGQLDAAPARERAVEGATASLLDAESFSRYTRVPRLVDDSTHYERGDGLEHLRGGGWLYEREYFNGRYTWPTAAVPEIHTTTMTLVGLLGVALMVKRQRRRRPLWAY